MKILKSRIKNPFPMKVRCSICKSTMLLEDIDDVRNSITNHIRWVCIECGSIHQFSVSRTNKIRAWIGSDKRKREGNHE